MVLMVLVMVMALAVADGTDGTDGADGTVGTVGTGSADGQGAQRGTTTLELTAQTVTRAGTKPQIAPTPSRI